MLGFSPLPRTLQAALRDAEHPRAEVRLSTLSDLKRLTREGEPAAHAALARVLKQDPEPRLRAGAALALADIDARAELPTLLAALADPDAGVRQMALLGVGELSTPGDAIATEAALRALGDDGAPVRYQALVALARLQRAAALDALLTGSRDPDAEVRHVAFRLAEEVFGAEPLELVPLPLLQRARGALRDDDAAVQLAAAILLAVFDDASGRERLVATVNERSRIRHTEDEVIAIELCGELGLSQAEPGLERRAFGTWGAGGPVSWHARVALAELGHARAKAVILRGLSAWSRDARTLAVAAAGRARMTEAREILLKMADAPGRAEPDAVKDALALIDGAPFAARS